MPENEVGVGGLTTEQIENIKKALEPLMSMLRRMSGDINTFYEDADEAQKKFADSAKKSSQEIEKEREQLKTLHEQRLKELEDDVQAREEANRQYLISDTELARKQTDIFMQSLKERSKNMDEQEKTADGYRQKRLEKDRQALLNEQKQREQALMDEVEQSQLSDEEKLKYRNQYLENIKKINEEEKKSEIKSKAASKAIFRQEGIQGLAKSTLEDAQQRDVSSKDELHKQQLAYQEALEAYRANPNDPKAKEQLDLQRAMLKEAEKQSKTAGLQLKAAEAANELLETFEKSVERSMDMTSKFQPQLLARLQGTDKTFVSMSKLIKKNLALSPYVTQETVMQKIAELASQGIAYNLEQRAFLASIRDDIATTFDVANGTLLRLIRLQQQDSTAARMGMEATLTRLLNSMFGDTSYLTTLSDSVSEALIEAMSVRNQNDALQLEYTVQKWLGALTSLGVSQSGVQSIATAMGQLASGNVQQLVGTPMMTLIAMGAKQGGIDLSGMTSGFSIQEINSILKGIVLQLQESKIGSQNLVVLNALSSVLGVSPSDLMGTSNLTQTEIEQIFGSTLTYSGATKEINYQLSQISERLSLKTMMDNLYQNFSYALGESVGTSPVLYGLYRGADIMKGITGGIHLPAISIFGNAVDLSAFTIEDLIKTGVMGISAVGGLMSMASSLASGGGISLDSWGGTTVNTRGGLQQLGVTGVSSSKSGSGYVASGSVEDITTQSMMEQKENPSLAAATEEDKPEHTFDEFYNKVVVEDDKAVRVVLANKEPLPVHIQKCESVLRLAAGGSSGIIGDIMDSFTGGSSENNKVLYDILDKLGALSYLEEIKDTEINIQATTGEIRDTTESIEGSIGSIGLYA